MQNFLEPVYTTGAQPPHGANDSFYSNPEFDAAVKAGNKALSEAEATAHYQRAEDILLEDMPIMPVYFARAQYVHSERVKTVVLDGFGQLQPELLELV